MTGGQTNICSTSLAGMRLERRDLLCTEQIESARGSTRVPPCVAPTLDGAHALAVLRAHIAAVLDAEAAYDRHPHG